MIDIEAKRLEAEANFRRGCNCAQSVLLAFSRELNIDESLALKISQPFGGGVCRTRELCGTVSGMLMALGLKEGSDNPSDKEAKDRIYSIGQTLMKKFSDRNGSCICRDLLGLGSKNVVKNDPNSPISEARTEEYYRKRPCPALCGESASIFAEYLNSIEN